MCDRDVRLGLLRERMASSGVDVFMSVAPPDNQYLTGFTGTTSAVLATANKALFLCDSRYTEQAGQQVTSFEVEEVDGGIVKRLAERFAAFGVHRVAYDPACMTVSQLKAIEKESDAELVPVEGIVSVLRRVKSAEEIDRIRAASRLAEGVLGDLIEEVAEGMTERELAAWFEYEFKKRGARCASFETIALFGPRSSLPHGEPGDRALEAGDIILLDFGCRHQGYCSDLTRTYAFGRIPGAWFEEVYGIVLAAQMAALKALQPGVTCRDVDSVARGIIGEAGYGTHFGHGLGHGVGIEIHEGPRLNKESDIILEAGMVVTVEPGIYLPGQGGVRIEDLAVITEDGSALLSGSPKDLRVLDR